MVKQHKILTHLYEGDLPDSLDLGASVAVDSETMGLKPQRDRLCLLQLSSGDGKAHLVQFERGVYNAPNLIALFKNAAITKIFHYARFDVATIKFHLKTDVCSIFCTKIASKLVRTYTDRHGLKDLDRNMMTMFDESAISFQVILTKCDKIKDFDLIDLVSSIDDELTKHVAAYPRILPTSSKSGFSIPLMRVALAELLQ